MTGLQFVKKDIAKVFVPSAQQGTFFTWIVDGNGSCVLEAAAGAGKTSTLCEAVRIMTGSVFFGAFSKKIADGLQDRIGHLGIASISTFHAMGMRQWRKIASRVTVDANKVSDIYRDATRTDIFGGIMETPVVSLVSYAKQAGFGIDGCPSIEDDAGWEKLISHFGVETFNEGKQSELKGQIIAWAKSIYKESLRMCDDIIDFDDMILAPLYFDVTIDKFDWVLIDEAQDTNAVRRLMAMRMMHIGSRLVAVGDRHQAIFGFTGADADALDLIAEMCNAIRMPLNVSFRCPVKVIEYAHQWVKNISAKPGAKDGAVHHIEEHVMATLAKVGDMVLCRYNAPLMKQAYQFIMAGTPARVEGKEIGAGLKALVRRWKVGNLSLLLERLKTYEEREVKKQVDKKNTVGAEAVKDRVECARIVINRVTRIKNSATVLDVCAEIDRLFGLDPKDPNNRKPCIVLSSIHKAKGLEFPRVFWLQSSFTMAKQDWEHEQEKNLCYVAVTRAMDELYVVKAAAKPKE